MQQMNPNYMMYQQPQMQFNPYMQRMENLQQFQQVLQQPTMPTQQTQFQPLGKIVESMDIVKVTDIPMDGNMYYFPKADGTEIYAKQFGVDGKTRILTFEPVSDGEANNLSNEDRKDDIRAFGEVLEGIQNDIRLLNEKIDKMPKPTRVKKEVADSE